MIGLGKYLHAPFEPRRLSCCTGTAGTIAGETETLSITADMTAIAEMLW